MTTKCNQDDAFNILDGCALLFFATGVNHMVLSFIFIIYHLCQSYDKILYFLGDDVQIEDTPKSENLQVTMI